MSRVGRPRKAGKRQPNGQLKRPSAEERAKMELERQQREMQVVLAQPHRRGDVDQKRVSALGRFCVRKRLRQELFDAGEEYASIVRRWRAAKGVPTTERLGSSGNGPGPTDEAVRVWTARMVEIERALMAVSVNTFMTVRQLVLEDFDIGQDQDQQALAGLAEIAVLMGLMKAGSHPYRDARG